MYEIRRALSANGIDIYQRWLDSIRDRKAVLKIMTRVDRAEQGNFGVHRSVGSGVYEMVIDYGPGYRVYYAQAGTEIVILLGGGTKDLQQNDIDQAKELWRCVARGKS
ncbi:type II toxin-antitoxin system RelE/ParE family toxin [Pseudomonas tohonis]|uniref:type II toxin-antitoxin system RelE/ParE family toxin n=1 Tax=Pseudomonas tohonis TaxID=2725477 RepID=UPI001F3D1DB9|nr:type II toxin-antitoxin system RelE/ParE family toxin [Pseudomonas tohonis]